MDVFDLQAKIGINTTEYKKGITEASKSFSEFGGKVKDGAAKLAKISTAALGAAATGVSALVKQSVSAYADYEQLVGGIETLFGDSAKKVLANSEKAFATAGMSVNEYMETSIQGAASLINSLGGDTEKAAELMDVSIQDMADNVNKMGTNMEGVQNAYRGFSRGNFTMLDNLALGFAGTKEGMQELLDKAQELSGVEYDISSYADIVQAIHVVQEEMGITGTTAKEAAGTITGSMASVKAAWKNLTVEMAKADGDVGGAFQILGDNVGAVVDNMIPRIEQAIGGVGTLIEKAAPQVIGGIQKLLPRVLPSLIKTAGSLVASVGSAIFQTLATVPDMIETGRQWFAQLAYGLSDSTFDGGGILANLLDSVVSNAPYYLQYAEMLVSNLADQLLNADYKKLGSSVSSLFTSAVNSITDLIKDIDFYKVGEDIADFLNAIDWQEVANSLFDLLAAGIRAIPDIAVSFFANADLGNLMTMIGLLGAPKLLGGITDFTGGEEGQALGAAAGNSWSGAFMSGIKAFGLGWAIGSYLRDNVVIGDKTLGEWVDVGTEKAFDAIADNDILNKTQVGSALKNLKAEANSDEAETFTTIDGREALMFNADGTLSNAYKKNAEKIAEKSTEAWTQYATSKAAEENRKNGWEAFRKYNYVGPVKPENNAIGNYITQPTLTWAAEKEPEYMIPESKMDKVFSREGVTININVSGADLVASDTVAQKIAETLANLSIRQQRAVGGTAW